MIDADAFTPFFGLVEDVEDPLKNGRVRVRVFVHNADAGILPTENLKWFAQVVANSEASTHNGFSPTGLAVGSMVFGYYIDPHRQDGIVVGALTGLPGGVNDVSPAATGEGGPEVDKRRSPVTATDSKGGSWSEPETPYATEYPNNKVFRTKSGHLVEFDDTPGAERVVIQHSSGSFKEHHPDGKTVEKSTGDSFSINLGSQFIFVSGDVNLVAGGDYQINVANELHIKASKFVLECPDVDVLSGDIYMQAGMVTVDTPTMTVTGISYATDHISSGKSGASHTHSGVHGPTSPPL